jgi:hypothetical protein
MNQVITSVDATAASFSASPGFRGSGIPRSLRHGTELSEQAPCLSDLIEDIPLNALVNEKDSDRHDDACHGQGQGTFRVLSGQLGSFRVLIHA